jgi:hypothetical protein
MEYPMEQLRNEVEACIEVWKEIFAHLFDGRAEYAYAKGSAIKDWDTPIDYVPLLSDVDIHVKLTGATVLFEWAEDPFRRSVAISQAYEEKYLERIPEPVHIPRTQLVVLNSLLEDPGFILPTDSSSTRVIMGTPKLGIKASNDELRSIDMNNLLELGETLDALPAQMVDRTGIDLWTLIRRLNWRVSPSPVRLLTQIGVHPIDVWDWNRTRICDALDEHGLQDVSEPYREFYMAGWRMFNDGFHKTSPMRDVVLKAHEVLSACYQHAKTMAGT